MQYHFKIYNDKKSLWAECIEIDGCFTQGDTIEELRINMKEALNLHLDEPFDSKVIFPLPRENVKGKNIEKVKVEPSIAFAMLLRYNRLKNNLTQKQMAEKLKMKNLYSYQKLEKHPNPNLSTIQKIKEVFPEISIDNILA